MNRRFSVIDKINLFIRIYAGLFTVIIRVTSWFPFFILAMFQVAGLIVTTWFYLPIWVNVVYPILTSFLPSEVFHYPRYYLALPSVFAGFDSFILGPTVWVIVSAVAVYKLGGLHSGKNLLLKDGFKLAFRSYLPLLTFWVIETILILLIFFVPSQILEVFAEDSLRRKIVLNLGLQMTAYVVSAFLIYVIPGIIIGRKALGSALTDSVRLCFHNFFLTYFIIFIPSVFRLVLDMILTVFAPNILRLFNPELIFMILLIKVILGIFINLFIYGAATFIYKEMAE